jgi:Flp pilus assembly protein TadG
MICCAQRLHARRSAVAAVEAGVVLPVILLFLVGVIDLGRLGKIADSVSNAARNGAQYAATNSTTAADTVGIRSRAVTELQNLGSRYTVNGTNPTVTTTQVTYSGTNFVQVTVSFDMTNTAFFSFFPVNNITRTVQMPMMP